MNKSVIDSFTHFVFDVDRTIASTHEPVSPSISGYLRALIEHGNIVIVTARGIHEKLEVLAQTFFQNRSEHSLYFFTTSAAQAYRYDPNSGGLLKLYDKAKGDVSFQQFYQNYRDILKANAIELVDEVEFGHDLDRREVQVHDRTSQITLFFSNPDLRTESELFLKQLDVRYVLHGKNSLHVLPAGVDKRLSIDYLSEEEGSRFLVFADGFYHDDELKSYGNDLSFAELPAEQVTCINVGQHQPKLNSNIFYDPETDIFEADFTDALLKKIISGCDFNDLNLRLNLTESALS